MNAHYLGGRFAGLILIDVGKFGRGDVFRFVGGGVKLGPESHPHKAEGTYDDERHLPSPHLGQQGDAQRGHKCAY